MPINDGECHIAGDRAGDDAAVAAGSDEANTPTTCIIVIVFEAI